MAPAILLGEERPDFYTLQTLVQLFQRTRLRSPQQPALIYKESILTYAELDYLSNLLAIALRRQGLKSGQFVGLWMSRGLEPLIAQLAIAKAGGCWVPFAEDVPGERVMECLKDAEASFVLTDNQRLPSLQQHFPLTPEGRSIPRPLLYQEMITPDAGSSEDILLSVNLDPSAPAYLIYTSGSTGKPKGILVSHRSICHLLQAENAILGVRQADVVYQGFSLAFDMSFEEIWISYLVGATIWIAPHDVAVNPELISERLKSEHITVLHAVPTLAGVLNPEQPTLRLLNLGGEACTTSVLDRWAAPGRKIFNTYGPTETTVTATAALLSPGQEITIGAPLPNYEIIIRREDGSFCEIGEPGELCIAGPGVAIAYLKREDLTAQKFIPHPAPRSPLFDRLYRTGDLATMNEDKAIRFLGRTDDQVKIRGFRVELGEIEERLLLHPAVTQAAVVLRSETVASELNTKQDEQERARIDQLVAFLVVRQGAVVGSRELRVYLGGLLPAYMIPARFQLLDLMPRLTSGKIDRNALKQYELRSSEPVTLAEELDEPQRVLLSCAIKVFGVPEIDLDEDFFVDLGGHSLLAARFVTAVRADGRFRGLSLQDVYAHRTLRAMAATLSLQNSTDLSQLPLLPPYEGTPFLRRFLCGCAQALCLPGLIIYGMAQWLGAYFFYHFLTGSEGDATWIAIIASIFAYLVLEYTSLLIAIGAKWIILNRLRPGRYPLWGCTYFRWWLTSTIFRTAPIPIFYNSPLYPYILRLFGAKIGAQTFLSSCTVEAPDLLTIGDGASIGASATLVNVRIEKGEMIVGPITIGNECYVGTSSVLLENTTLEDGSRLGDLSTVPQGQTIPSYEEWSGAPAAYKRRVDSRSWREPITPSRSRQMLEIPLYLLMASLGSVLVLLPIFPGFIWLDSVSDKLQDISISLINIDVTEIEHLEILLLSLPAAGVMIAFTILIIVLLRRLVLREVKAGAYSIHSTFYYRKWFADLLFQQSLSMLHALYATVFTSTWMSWLGARVGHEAEISTASGVTPGLLTLGDETFVADSVTLGDDEIFRGWLELKPTELQARSFAGNGACIPQGTTVPSGSLIGVQSTPPEEGRAKPNQTWFGSPPILLPNREVFSQFSPELTYRPSLKRKIARGTVEVFRICVPQALIVAAGYTTVLDLFPILDDHHWTIFILALGYAGTFIGLTAFCGVLLAKWLLIGRYGKKAVPMWAKFVWFSEAVTNLYESTAVPLFLDRLMGTPFLPMLLRMLGATIGKGVYMGTTDLTEFDCVEIGDYAELNAYSGPQTHLFEDRVMKIDRVVIGAGATIGPRSIVLYGSEVEAGASLGPLSLVMKGEAIPTRTEWTGSPAQLVGEKIQ